MVGGSARLTKTASKQEPAATLVNREPIPSARRKKLPVLLVTGDDGLWSQIGPNLSADFAPKQLDSIDELLGLSPGPAIVLWDARAHAGPAALSRLQPLTAHCVIVALDAADNAAAWTPAVEHRHVSALVTLPVDPATLTEALASAHEELTARIVLLADDGAAPAHRASTAPLRIPWITAASLAAALIAAAATFIHFRGNTPPAGSMSAGGSAPAAGSAAAPGGSAVPGAPASATAPTASPPPGGGSVTEENVDLLIEKAQQAMLDRHFIEPAEGSALTLYRNALMLDPANGEAHQGLQRLLEILIARVQSALDERKFDVALQALETARSIAPDDGRLAPLDGRIGALRAELGPAEIQASINAQNFDRAAQLIDEAARSKTLSSAKTNQLRDELRRRRAEGEVARLMSLLDARLEQDHLIDPHNDNAVYYLEQARHAGASVSAVQSQYRELLKRLTQGAQGAIDQHHFLDADRFLAALRGLSAPPQALATLQRELAAARVQQTHEKQEPQLLDLARSRLAQGNVLEPDDDSALYYVNQLRAADPHNAGLAQISGAVQVQILDRARTAIDGGDYVKADALLQMAGTLGDSKDLNALRERMRVAALFGGNVPEEVPEKTLTRIKKLSVDYPERALSHQIEGEVQIAYTVTPQGTVTNITVLNSSPPGIFEAAATSAVSRLRYKPVLQNGKAVSVATKLRVIFQLSS
jgi:TonB family protein